MQRGSRERRDARVTMEAGMKIEVSEDELGLLIKAIEHYYAYIVAKQSEDLRAKELADRPARRYSL